MRPSAIKKKNKYSSERLHGPFSKPNKKSERLVLCILPMSVSIKQHVIKKGEHLTIFHFSLSTVFAGWVFISLYGKEISLDKIRIRTGSYPQIAYSQYYAPRCYLIGLVIKTYDIIILNRMKRETKDTQRN